MEFEASACGEVSTERSFSGKRHTLEDIMFTLVGDADIGSIVAMAFAIILFAATPAAMLLIFGTYSGGMRWLITLGMVFVMGFTAIYLMRKGTVVRKTAKQKKPAQTEFRGELTGLTDTVDRAASGYVYSQQMLRERLCEAILDRLAVARDLDPEEMAAMLETGDADFVGEDVLSKFLLENRRGRKGWEDAKNQSKGKSAERGRKFLLEIDDILRRMEAIV